MARGDSKLEFTVVAVPPLQANATIVIDPETGKGIITDPGGSAKRLMEIFREKGGTELVAIYCTHGHADHILGAPEIARSENVDIYFPREDMFLWETRFDQCRRFGIGCDETETMVPQQYIEDGDRTIFGDAEIIHTPGHSPGSMCFHFAEAKVLIAGDLLFRRSIGRTDLPGGSMETILHSIRSRIFSLSPDTLVITGHGPATTVGEEIEGNPFLHP